MILQINVICYIFKMTLNKWSFEFMFSFPSILFRSVIFTGSKNISILLFGSWYGYMINDVSISKVSEQFFETFIAIRSFLNGVSFKTSFFELLTAVSTDKTLGMKFLFHGSYNTSTNSFPTNTAVMDFPDDNKMEKLIICILT